MYKKKTATPEQLENIADKLGNALAMLMFVDAGLTEDQIQIMREAHRKVITLSPSPAVS